VKLELDTLRIHDINNVQALMLFNMSDAETFVGELTSRGYYLGSNVSYCPSSEFLRHRAG
jgi:hypothetical protein